MDTLPIGAYNRVTIGGRDYFATVRDIDVEISSDYMWIRGPDELVNECSHCGRFDVRRAECRSFDEAIARRWFIPVEDWPTSTAQHNPSGKDSR